MGLPARLLDAHGRPIAVCDGDAVAGGALLHAGMDENGVARIPVVESKFNANVKVSTSMYASRFVPFNVAEVSDGVPTTQRSTLFGSDGTYGSSLTYGEIITDSGYGPVSQRVLISSSANDNATGTGARLLALVYWSVDGMRRVMELVPQGTTPVTITFDPQAFFLERFYIEEAGSLGTGAGNITLQDGGSNFICQLISNAMPEGVKITNKACYITGITITGETLSSTFNNSLLISVWNYKDNSFVFTAPVWSGPASGAALGVPSGNLIKTPIYVPEPPASCVNLVYFASMPNFDTGGASAHEFTLLVEP